MRLYCSYFTKEPIAPETKGIIGVKYTTDRVGATKTVTVTQMLTDKHKDLTIKVLLADGASKAKFQLQYNKKLP
jgi:hypothetical protein